MSGPSPASPPATTRSQGSGHASDEPLHRVLARSDNEAAVVAIPEIEPVERPEQVHWVDPIHRRP